LGNFKYLVYEIEVVKHTEPGINPLFKIRHFPVLSFKTHGIFDTFEEAEYFIKINSMKKSAMVTTVHSYLSDVTEEAELIEEVR
jgi:hypothetical protein